MIPLLKSLASPDIAPVAENLHHALMATQQAQDDFQIKIDISRWLEFYRSHRKVLDISLDNIFSVLPDLSNKLEIKNGEIVSTLNNEDFLTSEHPVGILISELMFSDNYPKTGNVTLSDEGFFSFRIFLPCWLQYFEHPTSLFRRARLGDLDALDKLLRIDKRVIADTRISRHIATHGINPQRPEFRRLVKAIEGAPRKLSVTKVKTFLAAFLYGLSKHLGSPMTYPQIQDLFDQSAQERGLGLTDPDLEMAPHSFEKAVRRNLSFWGLRQTGQKEK
ncbi:hypothetical protein [uncultured Pseudodesulfovibrio sp.]|uniref:hypothetical protein n=1 Tax=uncultured Pseudodesulfovibrio sp. TaxID=2035858 RepID=UPI0029C99407|nr:hypothetical protein [uncultured Pseudodesulfovibrio sp.]